jgi:hypothetical protein
MENAQITRNSFMDSKLIASLINEDEILDKKSEFPEFFELGSWNESIKNSQNCSPDKFFSSPVALKQLNQSEKVRLPKLKLPDIQKGVKETKQSSISNSLRSNKVDRVIKIAELVAIDTSGARASDIPFRTKFRFSRPQNLKPLKAKERSNCPFPLGAYLPNPVDYLSQYSQQNLRYRKVSSIGYPSVFYDKFFIKSTSIKHLKSKSTLPERIQKKYNMSRFEDSSRKDLKFSLVKTRAKSLENETKSKKKILSPIYTNICNYHLELN